MSRRISSPLIAACLLACGAPIPPKPTRPAPPSAQLWIAGDVHLGRPSEPLHRLPLRGVGFVNLEGPLADVAPTGAGVRLTNDYAVPWRLFNVGVRAVGVINNHLDDLGPHGVHGTAGGLLALGLEPVQRRPARLRVRNQTLVMLQLQVGDDLSALRAPRAPGDHLVVAFHVDGPPSYVPTPALRRAVDEAIAAGAQVVVAHGTHAIGPVERRGDAVIAWGLGNFAFNCDCTREDEGLVLEVEFSGDVVRAAVVPIRAGLNGAPPRLAPDAPAIFELLTAIGSSPLHPDGVRAGF